MILSPSHITSLHDPWYTSLRSQYTLPTYQRRPLNLTSDEISQFKNDVRQAASDWQRDALNRHGPDYAGIIDGIVNRKTVQYRQMRSFLSEKNQTEAFQMIKFLAYGGRSRYFDTAETLSADITASIRSDRLKKGIETCKEALTEHLTASTLQEQRLNRAIEAVSGRMCEFEGSILTVASDMDLQGVEVTAEGVEASGLLTKWQSALADLMKWLNWSTWTTCQWGCRDDVGIRPILSQALLMEVAGDLSYTHVAHRPRWRFQSNTSVSRAKRA